jgi:tetratricopeptide (TPR) repeat protein
MISVSLAFFCQSGSAQIIESEIPPALRQKLNDLPDETAKIRLLLQTSEELIQKDPTQAIALTLTALSRARLAGAEPEIDQALSKAGKILQLNGAYDKAMDYYQAAYERALKSGNRKNQLKVRHNIAGFNMTVAGKFDESVYQEMRTLLNEYEQIWAQEKDSALIREFIPGILINLHYMAQMRDSLLEAETYLKRIRTLAKEIVLSDQLQLQLSTAEITLFIKIGKYQDAVKRGMLTKALCKRLHNEVMEASIDFYLGSAYVGLGDKQNASRAFQSCFDAGERLGNFILVAEAASKLAALHEQAGDPGHALHYSHKADLALEAMQKPGATAKATSVQMLAKVSELEKAMADMDKKSKLRQYLLLAVLLLLGIGSAGVIAVLKKRQQKVQAEKLAIEQQSTHTLKELAVLGTELENKDKQLATELMYRLQQKEQMLDIRQRLLEVNRQAKKEVKVELEKVIKGIELSSEDISWKDFELRFLRVHQDFYERLHAINPKLTNNERRLCAFLKLGFNTKEIATITGQSQRSIVVSRHRLRQKLGLEDAAFSFDEFFAKL